MVIQSGTVAMASSRSYSSNYSEVSAESNFGQYMNATLPEARDSGFDSLKGSSHDENFSFASYDASGRYAFDNKSMDISDEILNTNFLSEDTDSSAAEVKESTSKAVIKNVLGAKDVHFLTLHELLEQMIARRKEFLKHMLSLQYGGGGTTISYRYEETTEFSYSYTEEESTAYNAAGNVKTADGRDISFNVDMLMTRSFSEQYSVKQTTIKEAFLKDPLVINLKGEPASLKDQTFMFDIDSDGELDNISLLADYCGFLALDRNGDGKINDGSELFGAKSGNGFSDLAVFDMDGNGWIDENDEVFDKLRIWTKDESGNDRLIGLGVAGVGAICLLNAATDFTLKNNSNDTLGMIRRTGIALNENGTTATVQQLDMAVS